MKIFSSSSLCPSPAPPPPPSPFSSYSSWKKLSSTQRNEFLTKPLRQRGTWNYSGLNL